MSRPPPAVSSSPPDKQGAEGICNLSRSPPLLKPTTFKDNYCFFIASPLKCCPAAALQPSYFV